MAFLEDVAESADASDLEEKADELIALIANLAMGAFYSEELQRLIKPPRYAHITIIGDPVSEARTAAQRHEEAKEYREQLRDAVPAVEHLVVELLDYQNWS